MSEKPTSPKFYLFLGQEFVPNRKEAAGDLGRNESQNSFGLFDFRDLP
jgi:hypothetical protein